MVKRKESAKEVQARAINFAIGHFAGLQHRLQALGFYAFQQRVRALEEEFRHHTGRKEKK